MNCEEVTKELSASVLSPDSKHGRRLQAHIGECAACRARVEAVDALQSKLRIGLEQCDGIPDLTASVMSMLPREQRRAARRLGWKWAPACAALCTAVWLVTLRFSTPQKTAEYAPALPVSEPMVAQPPIDRPADTRRPPVLSGNREATRSRQRPAVSTGTKVLAASATPSKGQPSVPESKPEPPVRRIRECTPRDASPSVIVLVKAEETVDNTTDTANVDETTEIMVNGSPTNSQVVRMPAVERTVVVGQHDRCRTPLESATTDEYTSGPVDASDGG